MDRFIVLNLDEQNWLNCNLKSSMDRFIVPVASTAAVLLIIFKIQYG